MRDFPLEGISLYNTRASPHDAARRTTPGMRCDATWCHCDECDDCDVSPPLLLARNVAIFLRTCLRAYGGPACMPACLSADGGHAPPLSKPDYLPACLRASCSRPTCSPRGPCNGCGGPCGGPLRAPGHWWVFSRLRSLSSSDARTISTITDALSCSSITVLAERIRHA